MNKIYINSLIFTFKATNNISYLKQAKKLINKMIAENSYNK
jgi:uncharacterized protein YyaL (SSP411 family)